MKQVEEEFLTDSFIVVIISNGEANIGGVHLFLNPVLADSDDLFFPLLRDDGKDHHLFRIINDGKPLEQLMGKVLTYGEEPSIEALIR